MTDAKPNTRDSRSAERKTINVAAIIHMPDGYRMRCFVKDFSKTGALLVVATVLGLPNEFPLQAIGGPRRNVRVVRRSAGKVAVRFV
jgi:hypothetical protein